MTISTLIFWAIIVIFSLCLIMFKGFRDGLKTLIGGFLGIFIEDWAKTPEGTKATYQQAIEEQEGVHSRAMSVYKDLAGKLALSQENLANYSQTLKRLEQECENLAKFNKTDELMIKAEQREEALEQVTIFQKNIARLEPMVEDAKDVAQKAENDLIKLKRKKNTQVMELQLNNSIDESLSEISKLKKQSGTSKLLQIVDDGVAESKSRAAGAKVLYENKLETKIERAEQVTKKLATSSYVEELKKKYNNK